MTDTNQIAREWIAAREVIAGFLHENSPMDSSQCANYARAVLACLAAHDPPLLLCSKPDLDAQHEREQRLRAVIDDAAGKLEMLNGRCIPSGPLVEIMGELYAALDVTAGGETR